MGVNTLNRNFLDAKFLIFEHLKIEKLQEYESLGDSNRKTITMIVDEALKLAKGVLGPTMQDGDREGCHFENGTVRFPESYYRAGSCLPKQDGNEQNLCNVYRFGNVGLDILPV